MARDKVKRAFIWIRNSLRIIDRTTLPGEILGEIRPGLDVFGWDRLSPAPAGEGIGPTDANAQGSLAADIVALAAVPEGVMRYVFRASCSHDDPVVGGLTLSIQVRNGSIDVGLNPSAVVEAQPIRHGVERSFLLEPGEQLICRSIPAPAAAQRIFIRYRFVDIDFGEYVAPR